MTKDVSTPTAEDLSRLREIAEEGRRTPLLGGKHLILWGCLIAFAALVNWAMAAGVVIWPGWMLAVVWFGLLAIGWAGSAMLGRGAGRRSGAMTVGNRVEYTVWMTLGIFLSSIAVSIFLYMQIGPAIYAPERARFFAMMAPIGFGAYAMGLNASAVAGDEPRLKPFVFLSIAFSVACVLLLGTSTQLLAMAAGLIVVSVIPGLMLVNAEKSRSPKNLPSKNAA